MNQLIKFVQSQEIQKSQSVAGESFILIFRDLQALINFLVYEQEVYEASQIDARVIGYDIYEDRYLMLIHFSTVQQIPQGNPHIPSFYREIKQFKLGFSREITYMKSQCIITYDPLCLVTIDHSLFSAHSPLFAQNIQLVQQQSDLFTIAGTDRRVGQIAGKNQIAAINKPRQSRRNTTTSRRQNNKNSKTSQQMINMTQIEDTFCAENSCDDFQELPATIAQIPQPQIQMQQQPIQDVIMPQQQINIGTKHKGFKSFFK